LNEMVLDTTVLVSKDISIIMLGLFWMQDNKVVTKFESSVVEIHGEQNLLTSMKMFDDHRRSDIQRRVNATVDYESYPESSATATTGIIDQRSEYDFRRHNADDEDLQVVYKWIKYRDVPRSVDDVAALSPELKIFWEQYDRLVLQGDD